MAVTWLTEGLKTNPLAGTVLADTRDAFTTSRREILQAGSVTIIISASTGMEVTLKWYRVPNPRTPTVIQDVREQVIPAVLSLVTLTLPADLLLTGGLQVVTREDLVDGRVQASILVET